MYATLVLVNGNIYTLDGSKREEAIAIKGELIIKVGSNKQIKEMINFDTEIIDLKGKSVLPGFNDTHVHLVGYGNTINAVELNDVTSIDELVNKCKQFIEEREIEPGKWIYGRGWNQNLFSDDDKRFPTRQDLDMISTKHQILLIRICGHVGLSNTKALEEVGVTKDTFIEGGSFDKDETGKPNGVIKEASLEWYKKNINPKPSVQDIKESILNGARELNKYGITSVHTEDSYDLGYGGDFMDIYNAYNSLVKEKNLPIRVYQKISLPKNDNLVKFLKTGLRTGQGNSYYKIGPLKQWCDGTMGARTAALLEDYNDELGNKGILVYEEDELYENVYLAHKNNMQVCLHAIGDRALETVLNVYERVLKELPKPHRHRIVHCQVGNLEQYKRIADLGLNINIQPPQTATDVPMMNPRLGNEREKEAHNWRTLTDLGVVISGSSDVPVELPNVFYGVHAIVNRKGIDGKPEEGWLPEQAVTVEEALKMYTINAANVAFEDDIKGTLTEGKLADMVIVDKDPFEIEKDKIKDINVEATIVGGTIRYNSESM